MHRVSLLLLALIAWLPSRVSQGVDPEDIPDLVQSSALYQSAARTDFDLDGDTDGFDWLKWQRNVGAGPAAGLQALGDSNYDFSVNIYDQQLWKARFGLPPSLLTDAAAFKLFLDPKGVVEGQVTAFIEIDNTGAGNRLSQSFVASHPQYSALIAGTTITSLGGGARQLYEFKIEFDAIDPLNPPIGPIDLLSLEVIDAKPTLGIADVDLGFKFLTGDFIKIYDTTTATSATFNNSQLDNVDLELGVPLVLDVNTVTGAVQMRNLFGAPLQINYYEITSATGSLNFNGWNSFDEAEGDPPGNGWEEAGGSGPEVLSESNLLGFAEFNIGQTRPFGNAFNPVGGVQDLVFSFATPSNTFANGVVMYHTPAPVAPVPEPTSIVLGLLSLVGAAAQGRRARRTSVG